MHRPQWLAALYIRRGPRNRARTCPSCKGHRTKRPDQGIPVRGNHISARRAPSLKMISGMWPILLYQTLPKMEPDERLVSYQTCARKPCDARARTMAFAPCPCRPHVLDASAPPRPREDFPKNSFAGFSFFVKCPHPFLARDVARMPPFGELWARDCLEALRRRGPQIPALPAMVCSRGIAGGLTNTARKKQRHRYPDPRCVAGWTLKETTSRPRRSVQLPAWNEALMACHAGGTSSGQCGCKQIMA